MKVRELRDLLNQLMTDLPNTSEDDIYFYDPCNDEQELFCFDEIVIEYDLNNEGRYICLK